MQEDDLGTALVNVSPSADEAVQQFKTEAIRLREYGQTLVIASDEDIVAVTQILSTVAKVKKGLEDKRKEFVGPLQGYVKSINDIFKGFSDPIEEADRLIRGKVLEFQRAQEAKQREIEEINRMRLEAAEREKAIKGEVSEPVELVESVPEPLTRVTTEAGTLGKRMVRKWEVLDFSLLPDDYKTLDSARITKVVRAGIPEIPGVRIYEEAILTVAPAE